MKAMILAAGLGTRLRPWTLSHPKALVEVAGIPMLERVIVSLKAQGVSRIVVNIHHFGEQIIDFLAARNFGVEISVSDERGCLLDTGGGIAHARDLLLRDSEPLLVHNVDILSDAPLRKLMEAHKAAEPMATLLVSSRKSSRRLVFNRASMQLRGWHNLNSGEFKPAGFSPEGAKDFELAFSGIHVLGMDVFAKMDEQGFKGAFPIMDFYLKACSEERILGFEVEKLNLIDIGKPETLSQANILLNQA